MAEIRFGETELRSFVDEIVRAVHSELRDHEIFKDRLAINESEAAKCLGLNSWQLRDLRLAGKIGFCRIVGNRVRYTADDLMTYLHGTHQPGNRFDV